MLCGIAHGETTWIRDCTAAMAAQGEHVDGDEQELGIRFRVKIGGRAPVHSPAEWSRLLTRLVLLPVQLPHSLYSAPVPCLPAYTARRYIVSRPRNLTGLFPFAFTRNHHSLALRNTRHIQNSISTRFDIAHLSYSLAHLFDPKSQLGLDLTVRGIDPRRS